MGFLVQAQQPAPPAAGAGQPAAAPAVTTPVTNLGSDANGNPLRRALKTGHVSNYDEAKVAPYTLPDPLVSADGRRVTDARAWSTRRRPEILKLYETEIYGRVPANAPKVTWEVTETDRAARDGAAVMKRVVGRHRRRAGRSARQPHGVHAVEGDRTSAADPAGELRRRGGPRRRAGRSSPPVAAAAPAAGTQPAAGAPPVAGRGRGGPGTGEPPVAAEILARGWGYATVGYNDIQPDRANSWNQGVIGLTLQPGQTQPGPDEWGTISAWSWGISRIVDYFETDASVNAKQIAIQGHSRLGKTVLWAAAKDERIAAVFSSCSGEMGAALARRDWGETVDDMAQNFGWQFAGNFQKWSGRWNDMPVDAHMLIALSAPRPAFITGGTTDQWADPVGEFLATVAAGPVYRLLGRKDLGVTALPPLDTPLTGGDLGWHYHTGGHTATPADWAAFLEFLSKYFKG